MKKPQYILIAGVNGAGKSTLYQVQPKLFQDTVRINADEILQRFGGDWRKNSDNLKAMREVSKQIQDSIQAKQSFHQETTLAGSAYAFEKRITQVKEAGYTFYLIYVGLNFSDLAIQRVAKRVQKGGHGIPVETIQRRYKQSLENLSRLAPLADTLLLFDNTDLFRPVFEKENGKIKINRLDTILWIPDSADFVSKLR